MWGFVVRNLLLESRTQARQIHARKGPLLCGLVVVTEGFEFVSRAHFGRSSGRGRWYSGHMGLETTARRAAQPGLSASS